jgi:hypothetical protein
MWTQIFKLNGYDAAGRHRLVPVEDGPTVQLLSQDGNHNCTYFVAGEPPVTIPSHEFFAQFREATPDEIEGREAPKLRTRGRATAET